MPIAMAKTIAQKASSSVAGKSAKKSSSTLFLLWTDLPKSPCKTCHTKSRNCTGSGRSRPICARSSWWRTGSTTRSPSSIWMGSPGIAWIRRKASSAAPRKVGMISSTRWMTKRIMRERQAQKRRTGGGIASAGSIRLYERRLLQTDVFEVVHAERIDDIASDLLAHRHVDDRMHQRHDRRFVMDELLGLLVDHDPFRLVGRLQALLQQRVVVVVAPLLIVLP